MKAQKQALMRLSISDGEYILVRKSTVERIFVLNLKVRKPRFYAQAVWVGRLVGTKLVVE